MVISKSSLDLLITILCCTGKGAMDPCACMFPLGLCKFGYRHVSIESSVSNAYCRVRILP